MNTSGTSGTHDTETFNRGNAAGEASADKVKGAGNIDPTETPAASEETGLPKNAGKQEGEKETIYIEVLTEESESQGRPADFSYFAEEMPPSSGFRWWYAPAIAAPVVIAAGTTLTTLLLVRRRHKREEMEAAAAAAAAARNWLDVLRMRPAMNQAGGLFQRGVKWSRGTVQSVPPQIGAWRTRMPMQVGAWRDLATGRAARLRKLALSNAQSYVDAARAQAQATRDSAYQAMNNAGDRVSSTTSHTLAFGLGALVSAVATYVLRWRQRMMDAESEYSATGGTNRMHEEPIL
ncbi:MAG: hypothetical protein C5B60_03055 [Chloroflexi bacterium]|nr:MAG: hypothetical protein C5B60_03055 [Chloroflexota bacterium]